jgi:ADP-ribose pyrophosphatase
LSDDGIAAGYARVREVLVYSNDRVLFYDDHIRRPGGGPGRYVRLAFRQRVPGVVIVPETPDGRLLLVRMSRYAFLDESIEFPRGSGEAGEPTVETARRELMEETGLVAGELRPLGRHRPDTSVLEVEAEVFLAPVAAGAEARFRADHDEGITGAVWVTREAAWGMVRAGEIRDGFTLGALALLHAHS